MGLAALARTNGIIIAPAIALGIWRSPRLSWRSVRSVIVLAVTTLVVLVPWCVRDTVVFGGFVPIATQTGFTLAGTYNTISEHNRGSPGAWQVPTMAPYHALLRRHENEAKLDNAFLSDALGFAENHPQYVAKVAYFNLGRLLELQGPATELPAARESGISNPVSDLDVYAFYALAILALSAVLTGALRRAPIFVWLVPLFIALSLIFAIAYMRYRLPIDPFLILLVAASFPRLRNGQHERKRPARHSQ